MAFPPLLEQYLDELRELANTPALEAQLRAAPGRRARLLSAADLLSDTCFALDAFLGVHPDVEVEDTKGDQYLAAYGALQAMYLQQDALRSLHEVFGVAFELPDSLREIRDIRNDSVGHPTDRRGSTFHFVGRYSLSRHGFQLMSIDAAGVPSFRDVYLDRLAMTHQEMAATVLHSLLEAVREQLRAVESPGST